MANSTKIAIVGLMILLVVVVAKFVKNGTPVSADGKAKEGQSQQEGEEKGASQVAAGGGTAQRAVPSTGARKVASKTPARKPGEGARLADRKGQSSMKRGQRNGAASRGQSTAGSRDDLLERHGPRARWNDTRRQRGTTSNTPNQKGSFRPAQQPSAGPSSGGDKSSRALVNSRTRENGLSVDTDDARGSEAVEKSDAPISRARKEQLAEASKRRARFPDAETSAGPATRNAPPSKLYDLPDDASKKAGKSVGDDGTARSDALAKEAPGSTRKSYGLRPSRRGEDNSSDSPAKPTQTLGYPKVHQIAKGESPWRVAAKYYGRATPKLCEHIMNANPGVKFHPGKSLKIPAPPADLKVSTRPSGKKDSKPAKLVTANPSNSAGSSGKARKGTAPKRGAGKSTAAADDKTWYTVQKGDSLSKIAKRFYSDSTKYPKIVKANPQLDLHFTVLLPGTRLKIPR